MAESNSSHNNPDGRGQRKFRYGASSRDDEEYPLSRREDEMSPEEVEAYLAKQIELEEQQKTGGDRTSARSQTTYGAGGKKFASRSTTTNSRSQIGSGGRDGEETSESGGRSGAGTRTIRRRPDQDFPELRTLRRWSLVSRWWMRSLGEGFYRFITLDWNLEEGGAALANWRPTQQTLWRFSTLTGAASLLLTLLLFWHYRGRPEAVSELNTLASTNAEETVPDFSEEDTIEPTPPPQLVRVKESAPDFSDFEQGEQSRLAMASDDDTIDFSREPTITPEAPLPIEPEVIVAEPMETEFRSPLRVTNEDDFVPPSAAKAKATSTTIVESEEPPKKPVMAEEDWNPGSRKQDDMEEMVREFKSVPLDDFEPEPAKPSSQGVVTRVQEEKPVQKIVPEPIRDLEPEPPIVRRDPPPTSRQRIAISRTGSWANDQQGAAIYSMTIRNLESQELAELDITETLPQGSQFISASRGGEYDRASHSVRWTISSLSGNASSDLSVRVQPQIVTRTPQAPEGSPQTSRVQISDRRGIVENRSWNVDHVPCYPVTSGYSSGSTGIVPAGYYQGSSESEYFFGW